MYNVQCAKCNVQSYKSIVQPYCKIAYFFSISAIFPLFLRFSGYCCYFPAVRAPQ